MIGLADPLALLSIAVLAPVLYAASYAARRRREADDAFGGDASLRRERTLWRRPLQDVLLLGAIVLAVIAVARPHWGEEERPLTRLGIDVAIALDISRSMTASDIEPSRAEAAAAAIDELFNHLRGDRVGLVTFAGDAFERAKEWWRSMASDPDAAYDDVVALDGAAIEPRVTWGINPGQSVGVSERIPDPASAPADAGAVSEALDFMGFTAGSPISGTRVDVAFVGSCTNSRLSDLREAARVVKGHRVASHVRALVVPGSKNVRRAAEAEGLHEIFREAGFEWRGAGCSMCLAMNPDRLDGREVCASSSNRNFKGRQGSPTGRTLLMSPAMVAAAAVGGEVTDVRTLL